MTFLTLKQQEQLQTIIEDKDCIEQLEEALKTFYGFYQPTCKIEEDAHKCENMNK